MCGIVGVVDPSLDRSRLEASLKLLRHRGPDGDGVFLEPDRHLGFGHTRLSIIDLETGAQPLHSADARLVLVCNGELYDFERQRGELQREGSRFTTNSDSELIIHLYLKYGEHFYQHLRGEFAFLLYDRSLGRLIAARDRFGIKPLYVARTKAGGWAFSSEIKGLFGTGLVEREIDLNAPRYDGATLFRGIEHVPPATAIVLDVLSNTPRMILLLAPEFSARFQIRHVPNLRRVQGSHRSGPDRGNSPTPQSRRAGRRLSEWRDRLRAGRSENEITCVVDTPCVHGFLCRRG